MTSPICDKNLMREATRTIREAYEQGNLTPEKVSLLEANGFPFLSRYTCTDHTGRTFPSKRAMCEAWGISAYAYQTRIKIGWSIERALTTPVVQTSCSDHTGREFPTRKAMCEHWGVTPSTFLNRRNRGMSLKDALEDRGSAVFDHTGEIFPNQTTMSKAWDVNASTFRYRIANGWSIEEALTGNRDKKTGPKSCTDHLGQEFPSELAMCKHWGISTSTFQDRTKRNGWSIEEALTGTGPLTKRGKPCADHLGREYPSITAMCRAWYISKNTYEQRRERGWTLEEALAGNREVASGVPKPCKDYLGQAFPSVAAMCRAWRVPESTYEGRITKGWTQEEALTGRRGKTPERKGKTCQDHEGNTYPSVKAMCRRWNVEKGVFNARLKRGWSLEQALAGKRGDAPERKGKTCQDHEGDIYPSVKAMCEAWGVRPARYYKRIKNGYTLEEALTGKRKKGSNSQ